MGRSFIQCGGLNSRAHLSVKNLAKGLSACRSSQKTNECPSLTKFTLGKRCPG